MAGISSKALNTGGNDNSCGCPNKKAFNGNELQNKEFSDGTGFEVYDFNARTYDQQIGRFTQIDPLSEDGSQESLTTYQFSGNNPSTFNDPDGKCPWCIGAIIGAAVEYGTQVATNLANGKSVRESLTNVDPNAILISAGAGALTGGLSAVAPKGAVAKVLVETAKVGVDAVESAAKQYNETGSVSIRATATDVVINKVSGKLTENINVNSKDKISTTEQKLDRAKRVSENDPSSSGRSSSVTKLENKLENQKSANAGAQQATGGVVTNATQGAINSSSARATQSIPLLKPDSGRASSDNTRLVQKSIRH